MTDDELARPSRSDHALRAALARAQAAHHQALQSVDHVVGFLGDGINDAPALHAADVGISVDTAVDIAKESADIILLEKSLLVLGDGVLEGRKVFSNILKYVRMGASSNFGNMFSVLGASAFLPFLPMAPMQVLTNNLLYDFSQVPIPTDNVDPEQIAKPRPWAMGEITRFILFIGPISSLFDYATFAVMWFVFGARTPAQAALFQTGWFVESLMTQTLIIHVIRTNRIPFLQSRSELAGDRDDGGDHGDWPLAAGVAASARAGLRGAARHVLAAARDHAGAVWTPHAGREDAAHPQEAAIAGAESSARSLCARRRGSTRAGGAPGKDPIVRS